MKTFNNLYLLIIIFFFGACNAQNYLPLTSSLSDIPNGAYVKDTNNDLDSFIGIYKAYYNNNEITLHISKEINKLEQRVQKYFYRDALNIKFIVKNASGQILQDTQNLQSLNSVNEFYSTKKRNNNSIAFYYSGTNCGVGWGTIYLNKINLTQFTWEYLPQEGSDENCPPGSNTTIYLPITKDLVFTKQ